MLPSAPLLGEQSTTSRCTKSPSRKPKCRAAWISTSPT